MEAKAGRADLPNLSIMKVLDKTRPLSSTTVAPATFSRRSIILYDKPVGTEQADYFRIYLQDALITSVQHSGSNENPTESVSFAFQAIEVAYKAEKDDGTLDGAVAAGFNLETLKSDYAAPDTF